MEYIVFLEEYYKTENGKLGWHKNYSFYHIPENFDIKTDWRFEEVKGKRKEAILLGSVDTAFPISFPLTLKNGATLEALKAITEVPNNLITELFNFKTLSFNTTPNISNGK